MIITRFGGCFAEGILEIDGQSIDKIPVDRLRNIINELTHKYPENMQYIFEALVVAHGVHEDLGHCDQCGDYCYKYTLEL